MYLSGVFINFNLPSADLLKEKKKKKSAQVLRRRGNTARSAGEEVQPELLPFETQSYGRINVIDDCA